MTTFVLILTIFWSNAPSVTAVAGFESEAACQAAGQLWMQDLVNSHLPGRNTFVCAGQTKK